MLLRYSYTPCKTILTPILSHLYLQLFKITLLVCRRLVREEAVPFLDGLDETVSGEATAAIKESFSIISYREFHVENFLR